MPASSPARLRRHTRRLRCRCLIAPTLIPGTGGRHGIALFAVANAATVLLLWAWPAPLAWSVGRALSGMPPAPSLSSSRRGWRPPRTSRAAPGSSRSTWFSTVSPSCWRSSPSCTSIRARCALPGGACLLSGIAPGFAHDRRSAAGDRAEAVVGPARSAPQGAGRRRRLARIWPAVDHGSGPLPGLCRRQWDYRRRTGSARACRHPTRRAGVAAAHWLPLPIGSSGRPPWQRRCPRRPWLVGSAAARSASAGWLPCCLRSASGVVCPAPPTPLQRCRVDPVVEPAAVLGTRRDRRAAAASLAMDRSGSPALFAYTASHQRADRGLPLPTIVSVRTLPRR